MPVDLFDGETFVAFADISGFRQLMQEEHRAAQALDHFYNAGYRILREQKGAGRNHVEGLFISDCAILFSTQTARRIEALSSLLAVIGDLNREMLDEDYMLMTSIAFGQFSYHQRIEFPGIDKRPVYGFAYLNAFLDNESGRPKLRPGQTRILRVGMPEEVTQAIQQGHPPFDCVEETAKHFYYYWMVQDPKEIDRFKREYTDAYTLKHRGMLRALQRATHARER